MSKTQYSNSHGFSHKRDTFVTKLILATITISLVLISISVALIRSMPKEAFSVVFNIKDKPKDMGYIYPQPTEDIRIKADRLREIHYEEYLERCYVPADAEMDNVYIYDNTKKCYLTFDDGPSPVTPQILDVLKQYKVKATFFVLGENVDKDPDLLRQIYKDGHAIGNHSYSHVYSSVYDTISGFQEEIIKCQNAIDNAIGKKYNNLVFRFPGGYDSLSSDIDKSNYTSSLNKLGYKYIDWSCLTGDSNTTEPTAEYLLDTLTYSIGNSVTGDIVVLMHDSPTKEITAKTLPKVIEYLYDEGYVFDTLNND